MDVFEPQQDGVVTRSQLRAGGCSAKREAAEIRRGRWRRVAGVVVQHSGPLTPRQRVWVAVLAHDAPAAATGRTALALAGLRDWPDDAISVVVPHGHRRRAIPGVRSTRSRVFDANVTVAGSPPRVPTPHALCDAVPHMATARAAGGLAIAVVQQRLARPEALISAVTDRPTLRHRKVVLGVLRDCLHGAQSLAELDMTPLLRRAGLDRPVRQSARVDANGRRRYLDIDCGTFSIEVDGPLHTTIRNWVADALRLNDLVIDGNRVLRFPSLLIRSDPDEVVRQLRRAARVFAGGGSAAAANG